MSEKKSGAKWIFILLLLLVIGVAAALAAAGFSRKSKGLPHPVQKVGLKDEILAFTVQHLPDIHSGLVRIDLELVLIGKELLRLDEIEKSFPHRKIIIDTERAEWNRVQRGLTSSLSKIEREIETFYVTHLVNRDKGRERIGQEREAVSAEIEKALEASRPHTGRLKKAAPKSWRDRIRAKIRG